MLHVPITSHVDMTAMSLYIPLYKITAMKNVTRSTGIPTFHTLAYPLNKYDCHIAHLCYAAVLQ